MRAFTIGHGTRPVGELLLVLREAGVKTLVDVRRFPGSRRHPQFNRQALGERLAEAGIRYRHAEELGGRRRGEPGEERFGCIRVAAFRSYAARMTTAAWQGALTAALAEPEPCLMCAETHWTRCHRRLIADLLTARGHEVVHLERLRGGDELDLLSSAAEPAAAGLDRLVFHQHKLFPEAEARDGSLYICGELVA